MKSKTSDLLLEYSVLWKSLSKRRQKQVLMLLFLSILAAFAEVSNLGILLPFLRILANPESFIKSSGVFGAWLTSWNRQTLILALGLSFLSVVALSALLRSVTTYGHLKLTALLGADIGETVLWRILVKPYSWHLKQNSSESIGLVTKDIDLVVQNIYAILALFINGIIASLISVALVGISPVIMLSMAAALGSFYWIVYCQTRAQLKHDGWIQSVSYSKSVQMTQEAIGGIRDILIDKTQPYYIQRFDKANRSYRLAAGRINYKAQIPRYLIENFAMALITIAVLIMSLNGNSLDSILPLLGSLTLGAYRLLQPVQQCFNSVAFLQANTDPWRKVKKYLNPSERLYIGAPNSRSLACDYQNLDIELDKVSFRYSDDSPWVLQELSLTIPSGSCIGFVGGTGSGKSTTIDLILGLLTPQKGHVLVAGNSLHEQPGLLDSWHQNIAHVPQHIYLTDASFAENIAFGIPADEIDMQRVQESAQRACIHDLITRQPNGYQSLVGERGIRLSGGQRQRIGIARALYKQAKVLILDEATSALDNQTEALVIDAINKLDDDITIIMIAHRISTLKKCDLIYLLSNGKVADKGRFSELLRESEAFRHIANIDQNSLLIA